VSRSAGAVPIGLHAVPRPELHRTDLPPELAWLTGVLWPNGDVGLGGGEPPEGFRVAESFDVVPNTSRPKILVPSWDPSLVGAALRRFDDGMSNAARLRRAWAARAAGVAPGRFPQLTVSLPREPIGGELVTHVVREALDRPDVAVAYTFGAPGPSRKPVGQALSPDGQVLAFAKIGCNGSTDAFVRREASALRRWWIRRPHAFSVPRMLAEPRLANGHVVAIVEPVPTSVRAERPPTTLPSIDATREIASAGGVGLAPLASTPFWRALLQRADAGASHARRAASLALGWVGEVLGRRPIWHGSWHGDWSPDNMSTVGGRLHVWDWEWAADGVPLGLDVLHFNFRLAVRRRDDVRRAADVALRRSSAPLGALGVPDEDRALLLVCYFAEMLLRSEEGPDDASRAATSDALLDELRRWVGRS
jgi:hypothetical protein